jgi:hypothetical protein
MSGVAANVSVQYTRYGGYTCGSACVCDVECVGRHLIRSSYVVMSTWNFKRRLDLPL